MRASAPWVMSSSDGEGSCGSEIESVERGLLKGGGRVEAAVIACVRRLNCD